MMDFNRQGVVSLWVFLEEENPQDADKDVLQHFCGVAPESYDLDFQEGATSEDLQPIVTFLSQLSYSDSFIRNALEVARRMGIKDVFGVLAQFDFAYDPGKVQRPMRRDPVFLGYFNWHE